MGTFSGSQISQVLEPVFPVRMNSTKVQKKKQAKIGETVEFTDWLEHYDYFKEARIKVKKILDEKLKMIDKLLNVLKNKMNEWMFSSMSLWYFFYCSRNLIDFPDKVVFNRKSIVLQVCVNTSAL